MTVPRATSGAALAVAALLAGCGDDQSGPSDPDADHDFIGIITEQTAGRWIFEVRLLQQGLGRCEDMEDDYFFETDTLALCDGDTLTFAYYFLVGANDIEPFDCAYTGGLDDFSGTCTYTQPRDADCGFLHTASIIGSFTSTGLTAELEFLREAQGGEDCTNLQFFNCLADGPRFRLSGTREGAPDCPPGLPARKSAFRKRTRLRN